MGESAVVAGRHHRGAQRVEIKFYLTFTLQSFTSESLPPLCSSPPATFGASF